MMKPNWTRVTKAENIPLREGRAVMLGGVKIAIFNLGDRFRAVQNECPHKGGPLSDGITSGSTIVCPLHNWGFDLETGCGVRASSAACLMTYATRVEDGIVMVDMRSGSRIEPGEAAA